MELSSSLKHKIKINNSYESEPSSGSGSSLNDNNDGLSFDDENMNLHYLLKPPSYDNEVTITTLDEPTAIHAPSTLKMNKFSSYDSKLPDKINAAFGFFPMMISSEESSFEGFSDSSIGKLQQKDFAKSKSNETVVQQPTPTDNQTKITPGKLVFSKLYDTIVEEHSNNAVDVQMLNESLLPYISYTSSTGSSSSNSAKPFSELSFNGKISSLTGLTNESVQICNAEQKTTLHKITESELESTTLNVSKLNDSFVLKKYSNEKSPDLFGDDDDENDGEEDDDSINKVNVDTQTTQTAERAASEQLDSSLNKSFICPTESSFAEDQAFDCVTGDIGENSQSMLVENCRRDKEMLRRIRKCLSGLPPPPCLTIPQLNLFDAILSRKQEILSFLTTPAALQHDNSNENTRPSITATSLLKPTHTLDETKTIAWKNILGVRQHGLSFNLTKASEYREYLSLSVVDRFVGAETASSYRNSPSSAKKRNIRMKQLTQSPGNRLSHLAKRRAIFSSANLATTSQKVYSVCGPQLVEKKKTKHRRKGTPKRKTPASKKKNRKTPSSSARKRLFRCDLIKPGPSRETSKRALFQSPANKLEQKQVQIVKPVIKPEIASRVEKSKRALFSPDIKQSFPPTSNALFSSSSKLETLLKRKRSAVDDDFDEDTAEELEAQSSKMFCSSSLETLTPRALKIKSRSFCIGAGLNSSFTSGTGTSYVNVTSHATTSTAINSFESLSHNQIPVGSSSSLIGNKMQRSHSEMVVPSNSLTENQRKKLLWAVSQALQEKKITAKHASFKQYASVLARVVRRIFQEYYQKSSTSNSETMLRLTKKYVYCVVAGQTADDIYFQAKAQMEKRKCQSTNRLAGYIGPEEYQQRKDAQKMSQALSSKIGSMQNLFGTESSMDSFSMSCISQSSSACRAETVTAGISQNSLFEQISQDMPNTLSCKSMSNSREHLAIQQNASLQNSSSKNNLGGLALRENVDCELRRSAQKNFTGKDQRNLSPFATTVQLGSGVLNASGARAKRQISFDS